MKEAFFFSFQSAHIRRIVERVLITCPTLVEHWARPFCQYFVITDIPSPSHHHISKRVEFFLLNVVEMFQTLSRQNFLHGTSSAGIPYQINLEIPLMYCSFCIICFSCVKKILIALLREKSNMNRWAIRRHGFWNASCWNTLITGTQHFLVEKYYTNAY